MKIVLHRSQCIGCGSCAAICPLYFELSDDGLAFLKGGAGKERQILEIKEAELDCVKEAAEVCPIQIIEITQHNNI